MASYGWNIQQFLECQPKQINSLMHRISVREHNEYAAQAALYGHKLEFKQAIKPAMKNTKLTKEQKQAANKLLNETIKKKAMQNGKK